MRQNKSIQLKAAVLLVVFALNTVIAFACSLGLNMGYNENHHKVEKIQPAVTAHSHSHAPGTKPHHHNTPATHSHDGNAKHSHDGNHSHGNDAATGHHHEKSSSNEDDCCTDAAIKFQTEDKKLQQSQSIDVKAPVFVAFLSAFLGFDLAPERATTTTKFLVPQFYPPPDIRIAIQSFLI